MEVKLLVKYHTIRNCNCYGILGETGAVVIDPGKCTDDLVNFLVDNSDKERLILLTHGHYDHMLGAEELRQKTGTPIACDERNCVETDYVTLPAMKFYSQTPFRMKVDKTFCSDCEFKVGDITVKAIHTPGHTIGGTSYLIGEHLFSGDTLFFETVGITKYATGSKEDMMNSLKKLKKLDKNIKVYPGHGKFTDIAHELEFNPFMR